MPDVPLRARTAEHVSAFLRGLEQQAHLDPWQVHQAREALRLLYQEFLLLCWARPWPLPAYSTPAVRLSSQACSFRDEVSAHVREPQHQQMLGRLRTELRARHYSALPELP